ncbi:MAG: hypothetical protein JO190_02095 [Candidatus Eremiobacteraeota bacterium]|nr:hypothetical protein [Candidatus Eremiobacteraeota bacterium]MBV8499574.1 hypothetical protein [Candidatus Eremiobacteraeota bacterium]
MAEPVDAIWGLAARYCVRQNAHAFMWLWGLFLILAGGSLASRRASSSFAVVLLIFAVVTVALAVAIFSACSAYAPLSMGLPASISATDETTIMCLSKDTLGTAVLWTLIVASSSAAFGSVLWGRARAKSAIGRAVAAIGALLLVLVAAALVLLGVFSFSLCSTNWVF